MDRPRKALISIQNIDDNKYLKWSIVRKNGDKDGKALHKVMNNVVHGKTMKNLRNRINVRLVNAQKDYVKWTLKRSYMLHNVLDNNLVTILRNLR